MRWGVGDVRCGIGEVRRRANSPVMLEGVDGLEETWLLVLLVMHWCWDYRVAISFQASVKVLCGHVTGAGGRAVQWLLEVMPFMD
jgi:hypothetical protein